MKNPIEKYFLLIALVVCIVALLAPSGFIWAKSIIPILLGIIMFGMGMTLEPKDFTGIYKVKWSVLLGLILQYTVMPLLAYLICRILGLPDDILVGMVLLGACPGGTASNVITYLAKGNVALSVSMTFASTLLCPLLTPLWMEALVGRTVDIPFLSMMFMLFLIVIVPIASGTFLRWLLGDKLKPALKLCPSVSILTIIFVIAIVFALNKQRIMQLPVLIAVAVVLHNLIGLAAGYWTARFFGCSEKTARTIGIEVGMQNSGLAASLAAKFFGNASALPGALFSLWHNLSGITLAKYWSSKPPKEENKPVSNPERL